MERTPSCPLSSTRPCKQRSEQTVAGPICKARGQNPLALAEGICLRVPLEQNLHVGRHFRAACCLWACKTRPSAMPTDPLP
eukprot:3095410-Heterocapsa_arctica.AAC.1